jgi:uncharacterized membrane protein YfcA
LLSAQQMLARRRESIAPSNACPGASSSAWSALRLDGAGYTVQRLPLGMALMYGAGLISALLGIGSGVLKIPAMDTALRLPIKVSSATSNFMIGVTAAAGAAAYFARGEIVTSITAPIALGSVLGALVGARLLMRLPGEKLRLLFVGILVLLALQMILAALGAHPFGAHV